MSHSGLLTIKVGLFLCLLYLLPFPVFLVELFKYVTTVCEVQQQRARNLHGQLIRNVLCDHVTVAV